MDKPSKSFSKIKSHCLGRGSFKIASKSNMNKTLDDTMDAIETENKNLRRALSIATESTKKSRGNSEIEAILSSYSSSSSVATGGTQHQENFDRINDQIQLYHQKIKNEQNAIIKVNQAISETQSKILAQRKVVGSSDAHSNAKTIEKHISILENRLNQSLVKYNQKVAQNKQLRKRIDDLKQERVVFDGIYKKLERELSEKAKQMSIVIEDGENASIERDRAQTELITLKKQADNSKKDFEQEWKKLGLLMENDKQIQQENIKSKSKTSDHLTASNDPNENDTNGLSKSHSLSSSELIEKESAISKEEKVRQSFIITSEQMQEFDEAMEKIKRATGLTDMDDIITTFLESEEKNFSLFNYVAHELNDEIEQLEGQIVSIKKEIEKAKGQGVTSDTQKKKVLKKMDERKRFADEKAQEYEQRYIDATKTIDEIKTIVTSLFTSTGCNRPTTEVDELLGDGAITESNIIQYLKMIEQRTVEIMQTYVEANESSNEEQSNNMNSIDSKKDMLSKTQMYIDLPTAEDFSSGEESDQENNERPLTREELQVITKRGMKAKIDRGRRLSMKKKW